MNLLVISVVSAQDTYDGKWFRATGKWDGNELVVERLQWRNPEKTATAGQVSGAIDTIDSAGRRFRIGPITVTVSNSTSLRGIKLSALKVGDVLRVSGQLSGAREMVADSIAKGDSALLQITGFSSATVANPDGTKSLTILGTPLRLAQPGYGEVKLLTLRQDSRRSDRQLTIPILGRPLTLGGEYVGGLLHRRNFRLEADEDDKRDDRTEFQNELKLEAFFPWSRTLAAFASMKVLYNAELLRRGGGREVERALERGESWLYWGSIGGTGLGLQIGRQNVAEAREWWWDDDLDSVRLYYDRGPFHAEFILGQEVARKSSLDHGGIDPEQEDVRRALGFASWTWAPRQRLEFFAARQDDRSQTQSVGAVINPDREDTSDAKFNWLGARAIGDYGFDKLGDVRYWLDLGWVRGRERRIEFDDDPGGIRVDEISEKKIRGSAFDLGASWELPFSLKPNVTLGFARGSGGDAGNVDKSYRQTSLHGNKWRYQGVKRFRYYGELLRPELSNLSVFTLGTGIRILSNSSIDLAYHRYRQVKEADFIRDGRIRADPSGESRDLGQEIDLVIGIRESKRWELALIGAHFRGGDAFRQQPSKNARLVLFEFSYNF